MPSPGSPPRRGSLLPFLIPDGRLGAQLYQAYGVPWLKNDPNQRLQNITPSEYSALVAAERSGGVITRWNGSLLFPAKIPDVIGVKERRYFDHTATHLHRGIGDLMRYAAQVTFAEVADFGPYHVLSPGTKRTQGRLTDAALYALALYIYSLGPLPNPNPFDSKAAAGKESSRGRRLPLGSRRERLKIGSASTRSQNPGQIKRRLSLARLVAHPPPTGCDETRHDS